MEQQKPAQRKIIILSCCSSNSRARGLEQKAARGSLKGPNKKKNLLCSACKAIVKSLTCTYRTKDSPSSSALLHTVESSLVACSSSALVGPFFCRAHGMSGVFLGVSRNVGMFYHFHQFSDFFLRVSTVFLAFLGFLPLNPMIFRASQGGGT